MRTILVVEDSLVCQYDAGILVNELELMHGLQLLLDYSLVVVFKIANGFGEKFRRHFDRIERVIRMRLHETVHVQ